MTQRAPDKSKCSKNAELKEFVELDHGRKSAQRKYATMLRESVEMKEQNLRADGRQRKQAIFQDRVAEGVIGPRLNLITKERDCHGATSESYNQSKSHTRQCREC